MRRYTLDSALGLLLSANVLLGVDCFGSLLRQLSALGLLLPADLLLGVDRLERRGGGGDDEGRNEQSKVRTA